jgi:signal transduction histidine kinase
VDAMLCCMQAGTQESQAMRSHPLRMRLGMVTAMAKVIEFCVPEKFRKQSGKCIPPYTGVRSRGLVHGVVMKKNLVASKPARKDAISESAICDELSRILESSMLESRLAERERIARDLHDTLLQGFQSLILKFHAIAGRIPAPDPVRQDMEKALDYADRVLTEGRDRVWSLRSGAVSPTDLPAAFQRVADELAQGRGVNVKTAVEGTARELHPVVLEESYSIGREALINALRHSEGINVEVKIIYHPTHFRLTVRDDGRGIEPDVLENGGRDGHWGLQGMRERAGRIGGQMELRCRCRPGSGTEVELTIPAKIAYQAIGGSARVRLARLFRTHSSGERSCS